MSCKRCWWEHNPKTVNDTMCNTCRHDFIRQSCDRLREINEKATKWRNDYAQNVQEGKWVLDYNNIKMQKIKAIHWVRERAWQNWIVYYIDIELEDWTRWTIGKKDKDAFRVWEEVEFDVKKEEKNWQTYTKFYEKKEEFKKQSYSKNYEKECVTMCMSYTKDLIVAWKVDYKDLSKVFKEIYFEVITTLSQ